MNKITETHKLANDRLYAKYPLIDESNLANHPEGYWKLWEIEMILEAYNEVQRKK